MLILASSSTRRLALLAQIGITPDHVVATAIDETPHTGEHPLRYVERMARAKAHTALLIHPDAVVLAADTVVACGRRILPKAETKEEARNCLAMLSGRRHRVITAVVVAKDQNIRMRTVTSVVQFKRLSEQEIAHYVANNEWQGKAGGYAIQGHAAALIPFISGSYSNIVGLPLHETAQLLLQFS